MFMLKIKSLFSVFFCFVVGMSFQAKAEEVVATVGAKQITLKEFNERYEDVLKRTFNPPSKEVFLEDLVRFEMGVQEAQKRNLESDPAVKQIMRQEIYKVLVERELGPKVKEIKITEDEMKTYYKKNPEVKISHILIEYKPDATTQQKVDAKKRASDILAEVQKSKRPFEELVNLYTDDVLSKKNGGDIGFQTRMTLVPALYDAALKLKKDEIKGLIETQYGYHIIKMTGQNNYEDANKQQIRAAVFEEKRKELFDAYFAKLKKVYPVNIKKSFAQ